MLLQIGLYGADDLPGHQGIALHIQVQVIAAIVGDHLVVETGVQVIHRETILLCDLLDDVVVAGVEDVVVMTEAPFSFKTTYAPPAPAPKHNTRTRRIIINAEPMPLFFSWFILFELFSFISIIPFEYASSICHYYMKSMYIFCETMGISQLIYSGMFHIAQFLQDHSCLIKR